MATRAKLGGKKVCLRLKFISKVSRLYRILNFKIFLYQYHIVYVLYQVSEHHRDQIIYVESICLKVDSTLNLKL